jgi:hypothetical protein
MNGKTQSPADPWALFRFSVIGGLLARPPAKGNLRKELTILARQLYTHPVTNKLTCFHFSTIEAWYYRAKNSGDPIMALGRKVRSDDGFKISKGVLRRIIKNAGYKYKKARKVLQIVTTNP